MATPFSDTSLLKIQRATDHEALFLSCQLNKNDTHGNPKNNALSGNIFPIKNDISRVYLYEGFLKWGYPRITKVIVNPWFQGFPILGNLYIPFLGQTHLEAIYKPPSCPLQVRCEWVLAGNQRWCWEISCYGHRSIVYEYGGSSPDLPWVIKLWAQTSAANKESP